MLEKNINTIKDMSNEDVSEKNIDNRFSSEALLELFIKDSLNKKNKDK